jgi:capsular polysaccharide transport system permease protein
VTRRRFPGLRTVSALMLREMSTTYGRSPGGYLWAILEPVAGTILLTAVFAAFIKTPPLGTSFPLFYATGILPFTLFTGISAVVAQAVNFSRPLLAYPSVTWVDAIVARFSLHFLTELMVAYVVFAGILILFPSPVILDHVVIAGGLALTGALAMGVGILNCFLFTQFPIWQRGWSILMRPMFLISGVIIPFESIPQPWRDWLWYNPIVHVIGLVRRGFYFSYDAPYVSVAYVLGLSGAAALIGLVFLSRYHRDLINL